MQIIPIKKISILLIDENALVREGIARLLQDAPDIEVVEQLSSGEEALNYMSATAAGNRTSDDAVSPQSPIRKLPDLVLLDACISNPGGIETTRELRRQHPECRVIALASVSSGILPAQMLRAGANGFITKSESIAELLKAVRSVAAGQTYVMPCVAARLAADPFGNESGGLFDKLSRRELQISQLLTEGNKVSQISTQLELSPKTVYSYRYRIFEKLGISSDVELTLLAVKQWPSRAASMNRWSREPLSYSHS
ncbi:MAG: DNA-binding response regulator [Pseudohongiella sp.]|nr:MAG: DNA-binding response regulator [Pseudohongiella sp.]